MGDSQRRNAVTIVSVYTDLHRNGNDCVFAPESRNTIPMVSEETGSTAVEAVSMWLLGTLPGQNVAVDALNGPG